MNIRSSEDEAEAVLHVKGIEKRRNARYRLGPVSLTLKRGYIYALMGPNGSGKSTFFHLLLGLVRPDAGQVDWFGGSSQDSELLDAKARIGFVSDQLNVPDLCWTMRKWAKVLAYWQPNWNERLYAELLRRYELSEEEHKKLRDLSKGQKSKAAFVMALAQQPEVLLLDEPSSGIDPFAWRLMVEDIGRFTENGYRTVLLATHVMEEIRKLSDYVLFFQDGEMLGLYEKDVLAQDWRMFWIDQGTPLEDDLPGVVSVERESPLRLISSQAARTEEALRQRGMHSWSQRPLEIDEIFLQLARKKNRGL